MAKGKILIIEDEEDIQELLAYNLGQEGYQLAQALTGEDGLKAARSQTPDLILLDLMLPGVDGLEVCKLLKNDPKTGHVPIIMLTAKGEESDIVAGLELGADDYVTKPFSPRVVIARLRAVLRRKSQPSSTPEKVVEIHGVSIHPGRHEVTVKGKLIDLTYTEFAILHCLARRPGWVFTRQQILDAIRGDDYPVTDRSVDVQVVGLRKKLGPVSKFIETVRGIGYRIKE